MRKTCENCGFTKNSHERKNFFKKVKINMIFADKPNLQPCKKFETNHTLTERRTKNETNKR